MARTDKLTGRQKKFANAYLACWNGTKAAITAGYSESSAAQIASENLKKPNIQAYIRARMREEDSFLIADSHETLAFLTAVMRGEVKDQFDLDAALADRLKATDALMKRQAISDAADTADGFIEALQGAAKNVWGSE